MKNRVNCSWLETKGIAHRGFHNNIDAPENSIKAFERAIEFGYAIELDIHILLDNNIVVFHDDNLIRLTGIDKLIEDCTYDEISNLNLQDSQEKIPLFKDVLTLVDGKVELLIELKNRGKVGRLEKKTYDLLKQYRGEYAIQSFNPYSVGWFYNNAPSVIRGQLSGSYRKEKLSMVTKFLLKNLLLNSVSKPNFINYEIKYLDSFPLKLQKLRGKLILGWTAKSEEEYKEALHYCNNAVFEGFEIEVIDHCKK
jgi:glycerophosphoryl diester phosphodiesterase